MTVKNHHTLKQLLSLAKTEKDKHLAVRIQVVALAKQGLTCPAIVELTGYGISQIFLEAKVDDLV
jgi:hypothetical protein